MKDTVDEVGHEKLPLGSVVEVAAPEALILKDEPFKVVSTPLIANKPAALYDDGRSPAR